MAFAPPFERPSTNINSKSPPQRAGGSFDRFAIMGKREKRMGGGGDDEKDDNKNSKTTTLQRSYFDVLGICCSSEIPLIENILNPLDGIKQVSVFVTTRTVIVVHDNLIISQSQIVKALNQARLEANVRVYGEKKSHRKKWPSPYAAASGLLLFLSFLKYVNPVFRWLALAAVAVGIFPIAFKSFVAVRNLRLDINILALIAVIGTVAMNDYLEAATIVFLFTIAEWLECRAAHKANAVMSSLLSMAPQKAVLVDTGEVVSVDEVKLGALLAVKAGEVIPIDGIVVEGKCEVDEKTLTGESFPVAKQNNSTVLAGTINLNGYITVKTTAVAKDCVVAKMANLVEEAQNNKSKAQRFIDKCAKFYTPAVIIISICIAVIPAALRFHDRNHWFHLALVVLVSACPCALILSTPVATFCTLTKAATSGLLIKGGDYLETLAKIKIVAFDKTGTVTRGEFIVTEFQALDQENVSLNTLLYWVSSIESKSSHPMAAALVDHGRSLSVEPKPENVDDFQNFPGEGVHGKIDGNDIYIGNRKIAIRANCTTVPEINDDVKDGRTVGYIFCGATPAGIFRLSDSCRTGAKEAMEELQSLGIKTAMLTGDSSASASQAQKELGKALDIVHAELLPEDKTRFINEFKRDGPTAMIGDGLNDAPALATADIGISMGVSGSALAIETGDVILMTNDIRKVPKAIKLARRAHMKVVENVVLSITPRIAILGLAFAGHPLIWAAVLADVGACVLVILNSMLLLRGTEKHRGKAGKCSTNHSAHKHKCCHTNNHFHQHDSHVPDPGYIDDNTHSSSHHVHKNCCSHQKQENSSQSCASKCHSKATYSGQCKKIKSADSTPDQDDSIGKVKLNESRCCIKKSQSAQHDHHAHSSCANHVVEKCCSQKSTQDFSLRQRCVASCQTKTSFSSSCEKMMGTNSTLILDGSATHGKLHGNVCCTHNTQSVHPDHHTQILEHDAGNICSSYSDHHIGDSCCSHDIDTTQKVTLLPAKSNSKSHCSISCKNVKYGDSNEKKEISASRVELQSECCTHDNESFQNHHHIEVPKSYGGNNHSTCSNHDISNDCHSHNNTRNVSRPQPECSKACNSSSCGKIKHVDSTTGQDESTGSPKLQISKHCNLQRLDTSNIDLESQEKLSNNCTEPFKSLNSCTHDDEHHLNLQNEGAHLNVKASNGAALEQGDGYLKLEPTPSCEKETNKSCKSCKKKLPEHNIEQEACASLEKKREIGGCCKSYMKECCRKHGDIGTNVLGGLNEIVIE